MASKPEKDIVIPKTTLYPPQKKVKKIARTGWIDGKGTEVPVVPPKLCSRRKGLTDYAAGFLWKPDPMVCIMLDVLCSEWETSRHEVLRRLMTPFAHVVKDAMKEESQTFTMSHTWDLRPSEWPDWKKR